MAIDRYEFDSGASVGRLSDLLFGSWLTLPADLPTGTGSSDCLLVGVLGDEVTSLRRAVGTVRLVRTSRAGLSLTVSSVDSIDLIDDAELGGFDVTKVEWETDAHRLVISGGVPAVLRLTVEELRVVVEVDWRQQWHSDHWTVFGRPRWTPAAGGFNPHDTA